LINAEEYKPKHLLAVDGVESRLELARNLGAEPWNFMTQREELDKRVKELTDGRGADVVIEVVGLSPALKMGFELLRPWGVISSVGVHNGEVSLILHLFKFIHVKLRRLEFRYHGPETKPMGRICVSRWDDVLCGRSFLKHWRCSRRSRIY
jgi:threonine dehydrogenase-like Zn-dependent dehydrogenase